MDLHPLISLLSDPGLSDRAKVMLAVLNRYPGTEARHLARACGHGQRKAQRALEELIRHGLVETQYHCRQVHYHFRAITRAPLAVGTPVGPEGVIRDPSHQHPVVESAQDAATRARFDADQGVAPAHDLSHSVRFDADQEGESAHDLSHSVRSVADPPSSNARVRTSSSSTSSSEEALSLPPLPPPDEDHRGLVGAGAEGEDEFLACWQQLARGCPTPSPAQVADLERQTTPSAPLALARRFLQEGRCLSKLKQPAKAWVYFSRACLSQTRTPPARASPQVPAPQSPIAPPERKKLLTLIDLHYQRRNRP